MGRQPPWHQQSWACVCACACACRVSACAHTCACECHEHVCVHVCGCACEHACRACHVCAVRHGQAWRISSHSLLGRGRCGQSAGRPGVAAAGPAWCVPSSTPPPTPCSAHSWAQPQVLVCVGRPVSAGPRSPKWNPVLWSCPVRPLLPAGCSHVRGRAGTEGRLLHPANGDSHLRSPASLAGRFGLLQAGGDSGEGPDYSFWSSAARALPGPLGGRA